MSRQRYNPHRRRGAPCTKKRIQWKGMMGRSVVPNLLRKHVPNLHGMKSPVESFIFTNRSSYPSFVCPIVVLRSNPNSVGCSISCQQEM